MVTPVPHRAGMPKRAPFRARHRRPVMHVVRPRRPEPRLLLEQLLHHPIKRGHRQVRHAVVAALIQAMKPRRVPTTARRRHRAGNPVPQTNPRTRRKDKALARRPVRAPGHRRATRKGLRRQPAKARLPATAKAVHPAPVRAGNLVQTQAKNPARGNRALANQKTRPISPGNHRPSRPRTVPARSHRTSPRSLRPETPHPGPQTLRLHRQPLIRIPGRNREGAKAEARRHPGHPASRAPAAPRIRRVAGPVIATKAARAVRSPRRT